MRRELWEVLVEMVESIDPGIAREYGIHIQDVTFDVPLEITTLISDVGFQLYADIPRSRWQEGIAMPVSRMQVTLQEIVDDEL